MQQQQFELNNDQVQKIEIVVSCRSLRDTDVFSKSDPRVVFKMKNSKTGQWFEVGRTETILNNLNPNFKAVFSVDFTFEQKQEVHFEVQDDDGKNSFDHLGECFTTIGAIVGARNNTLILDLVDRKTSKKAGKSKIILIADKVNECNDFIFTQWRGVKLMNTDGWFGKSDPFLRFKRVREDNTSITVYESEVIMDNLNPVWKAQEFSCAKLNNGNHLCPIKVECWDWQKSEKHQFIGEFTFTVDEVIKGKRDFDLVNPKKKSPGKLQLVQFNFIQKPSFLQYIRGNTQLNFILAVDFTASNGAVSTPESLHYCNPNLMNQYQQAVYGIGEILLDYDTDKRVPCYGFGGVPRFPGLTFGNAQHCFPMSGNPSNTEACGIQEIMNLYTYSLQHVSLSGPTYFNPILQETMKIAEGCKQQGSEVYSVLMILTDGEIHDMDPTINSLVYASDLPLSVIIIGVGNAEFNQMDRLDGDRTGLVDSRNKKATRDIVQFVPYRDFKGDIVRLAQEVLREIPQQLVNYMVQQSIKPKPAPNVFASQVQYQSVMPQQQPQGQPQFPPQAPPPANNVGIGGGQGNPQFMNQPPTQQMFSSMQYNNNNKQQQFNGGQMHQTTQLSPSQPQQQQPQGPYPVLNVPAGGQTQAQQNGITMAHSTYGNPNGPN